MAEPKIPLSHRDLLEAPITVALATVGPTGHPQATVFVFDPANPYRTLEVRGDVVIEPDPELATLARVLGAYGMDLESFPGPLEDRTTVTLYPTHVVAQGS